MKRLFVLSVLIIAMLWGCTQVNEDTPATEEKNASYKVEHYQQNITDDEYTLVETDSENKNGVTGEETSAQAKTYEGFTAKTVEQVKITADGSSVVKIYYDRNEITLTLNLDGGEGQTEITGKYGATVNVTVPIKTGYTFIGWNTALPTTFPAEDKTYRAKWGEILEITYDLNGGNWIDGFNPEEKCEFGKTIPLPTEENIEKTGYNFDGWLRGKKIVTETLSDVICDVTVIAQWSEIYAITYNLDGGINAESNPKEYTKKSETIILADATKAGYTFGGWYTDEACTEAKTEIVKGSTGEVTLYAKWTANKSGITITLPSINDTEINLQQVTSENTVTFTAADGFDSYAWYIDGVKQSETSATFAIDTSTIDPANYKIMVIVADGNKYHSATADLEIRN